MLRAILIGMTASVLGACQLERGVNPSVGPEEIETTVEQFSDLPVPRELRLLSSVNQSRAYHRGSFRSAALEYLGPVRIEDVQRFLRGRLPTHGWELVQEEQPTPEYIVQRWLRPQPAGVQYLLVAELRNEGARTRLHYDIRTQRSLSQSPPPTREAGEAAGQRRK